ncbi:MULTISPECIES: ubiquinone biosynthesis accessory factor UbiJ [Pseudomonas]|uniref:Ubiquinone biosynthesis accessory factor UbiJ n=1 Tax=Pseudomonas quercus TaxID=2722792 RepID=A0ABX0YEJ3_9PSED|nr:MULTISPECIES: SCP2 sterol-binding domain-containing protein [Pseudomonas]MBF7142144.1 SCP2 sterol-binding domain-containing protein [Pseudomonas sp. LY10J]NJP00682.1 SCP2 domain-containing protein [Pseudomonas quercus]
MVKDGLLAAAEAGLNATLRLDSTALPRLARLAGQVILVDCVQPLQRLYVIPGPEGLTLARHWEAPADCTLRAPLGTLVQLAVRKDKTRVLHAPDVTLSGDSAALMELAAVLEGLSLDWEYEVSRWLGPVPAALLGSHVRLHTQWAKRGGERMLATLADYLNEETQTLVGKREADARLRELDQLKLDTDRLQARFDRLLRTLEASDNA